MSEETTISLEQQEKVKLVIFSYIKWFLGTLVLGVLGTLSALFLNDACPLSEMQIRILQIFSLVLEATSFAQCGYSIQTWAGMSPAEQLNQRLFTLFASVGFFLVVFSYQLEP